MTGNRSHIEVLKIQLHYSFDIWDKRMFLIFIEANLELSFGFDNDANRWTFLEDMYWKYPYNLQNRTPISKE